MIELIDALASLKTPRRLPADAMIKSTDLCEAFNAGTDYNVWCLGNKALVEAYLTAPPATREYLIIAIAALASCYMRGVPTQGGQQ